MHDEAIEGDGHDHHQVQALKRLSSRAIQAKQKKKAPNVLYCIWMIIKADIYEYHHKKLHEWAGTGDEVQARLSADFQNIGLLAALMMTITVAQFLMMFDHKPFLCPEGADDPLVTNWIFLVYCVTLMLGVIGCVVSVIMSIVCLVIMNLVTEDETMIFLKHVDIEIKMPLVCLIIGILAWVVASIFLSYFLVMQMYGRILSGIVLLLALSVFYGMGRVFQATFKASYAVGMTHWHDTHNEDGTLKEGVQGNALEQSGEASQGSDSFANSQHDVGFGK
jgi:hypothetical protein